MKRNHYKKGSQVIYHYCNDWRRAVIVSPPQWYRPARDPDFQFEGETVKIKDEYGKTFVAWMYEIEPDLDPVTLTKNELKSLFGQIVRGSVLYSDYKNDVGVFEHVASDLYDSFWENLKRECDYDEDKIREADNATNFAEYAKSCRRNFFRPTLSL